MLKIIFLFFTPIVLAHSYEALDQFIQQEFEKSKVIGAAVTVVDHGKVSFMKTYGVQKKGNKTPVNLDTVFQLGSLSKPISAS
jgi:CubicO group peptidase (beta-lactamase class C family)